MVLGSYGSGVSMAASPIFGDAGLTAMGVTCTNPNVTAGNDYYYRICFLDPFQGTVLANFAMDKFQATTAYLRGEQGNEYDQGLIAFFEQAFTAAGGKVIKDSYLAIATLGFAEILRAIFQWQALGPITNGANMIKSFPTFSAFNIKSGGKTC